MSDGASLGPPLERSTSRSSSHSLTSAAAEQNRKAKSAEPGSTNAISDKANIVSPPPQSWRNSIQELQRRPSASHGYFTAGGEILAPIRNLPGTDFSVERNPSRSPRIEASKDHNRRASFTGKQSFTIGSSIMSNSWGSVPSTASSVAGSEQGDDLKSAKSPSTLNQGTSPPEKKELEPIPPPAKPIGSSSRRQSTSRAGNGRVFSSRRLSGVLGSSVGSHSPGSDKSAIRSEPMIGTVGICALDAKARSKPSRNILSRLNSHGEFEMVIFGDKVILDEEPENWPLCDYLICFFSDGFPLDKAIAYERLRKPFSVNDLPMQTVLWDRRICLRILDRFNVTTPPRIEVVRDGGPRAETAEIAQHIYERTGLRFPPRGSDEPGSKPPDKVYMKDADTLCVDGAELRKPFVEKPVSGEDHNIHIYYQGGGGRRLFRKINNKSSEADDSLGVPRCITDPGSSYVYESFLATDDNEDVKAYTVGPDYCHAETRKSPVVDGIVKRNTHGKEVRYVAELSKEEKRMARQITEGFGQRVCGFDLLRANGKSYVIDVNGWSFVKDNNGYYDHCANIMKDLFVREKIRKDRALEAELEDIHDGAGVRPSAGHFSALKSILKSPSMSRLGHHARHHDESLSEAISLNTTPMGSPQPTLEKTPVSAVQTSMPVIPVAEENTLATVVDESKVPMPASKSQWKLKGMAAVIRHADRTPKQKFKFTFHTKPFVNLLKGHREEVLLVGEAALNSVLESVKAAITEGVEDDAKLKQLQMTLLKKGSLPGTKVQIKPMFRSLKKDKAKSRSPENLRKASLLGETQSLEDSPEPRRKESLSNVTLSRAAAAEENLELEKLQLIVKWGGEPTHSARYQSQELGENLRADLLLMNRNALDDLKVFSSSERRVTTSAQIFTAAFMDMKEVPPDFITIRKDLLDDSNAAKDEMDKVKKKLKGLLRKGNKAPEQFAWPENMPEPYIVARSVVELMQFHRKVMRENYAKMHSNAASSLAAAASGPNVIPGISPLDVQPRWCSGEDAALFKERWEKLFDEFCDPEKVDPGRISELHDTIKFDALHNRAFLEWVFTPSAATFDQFFPSESKETTSDTGKPLRQDSIQSSQSREARSDSVSQGSKGEISAASARGANPLEKANNFAQLMGWRKRGAIVDHATLRNSANDPDTESYFSLYTVKPQAKASNDEKLTKLRELFLYSKVLFDFIGPQEYGITDAEKLEIGLLTSLPLLRAIVTDIEDMQASEGAKTRVYFTKESHIYTLLNCIIDGGIQTKIDRKKIPELDYLSTIGFELYESQNPTEDHENESYNYSIRISISPGCHTFEPLDVQLDSRHCIGFAQRRSLTAHNDYAQVLETLKARFQTIKLPKSFIAVNLSEKVPQAFERPRQKPDNGTPAPPNDDAEFRGRERERTQIPGDVGSAIVPSESSDGASAPLSAENKEAEEDRDATPKP